MKRSHTSRKTSAPESQLVAVRVQREKLTALDALARRKGVKRSTIIQLAIAEKLEREAAPNKPL